LTAGQRESIVTGYAIAKGKPVIGVRTDYRESQERGMNLMLSQGCTEIVHRPSFDEDNKALALDIARKISKVMKSQAK
jgi:nucleoside 2-deoxyribosyltransferase